VLAELDGPVERIIVTHFHPDHLGAAADVAALTGAPVAQGRLDQEQAVAAWGERRAPEALAAHMRAHGLPDEDAELLREQSMQLAQLVHLVGDPEPLGPGDQVEGWEVLHVPGHADGHIALLRDGILIAGDALLGDISPNVGLYPNSRPDPLGDFLDSLERIAQLAPHVAYAGHGAPIEDPAGRARELVKHHRERLDDVAGALRAEPRNAYSVSLDVFPEPLPPVQRRFALVETLAHLERLVREGRAVAVDGPAYVAT
jgi:glyoxylase-like metal-dependent hydrolase (beta-lactamase superfamily II)